MKTKIVFLVLSATCIIRLAAQPDASFADSRDGKTYKTVQIGTQTWMAENLNFDTTYSWCRDCEVYGRLYSYEAATWSCPEGWHLPSDGEWTTLVAYLGGFTVAGGKLKETGLEHWAKPNKGATNESGFTAIPHGYRSLNAVLNFEDKMGCWWTSTPAESDTQAWSMRMEAGKISVVRMPSARFTGLSVRCIKD
jgi:uncharacterized protein (TIGR02145 family)